MTLALISCSNTPPKLEQLPEVDDSDLIPEMEYRDCPDLKEPEEATPKAILEVNAFNLTVYVCERERANFYEKWYIEVREKHNSR